jgi:hypothetical protein
LGEELDTNKITLNCSEVQGWLLCNSISYEGLSEDIHLSEDSTGSSQTCCVREGGQNPDTMAAEEDADEPPAPSPEEQMRWMAEMMKKEAKEKSKKKKVKAKKTVKGKKQTKKKKEKK